MKEYKIAKGWAFLTYLFAPLLIGLFGWLLVLTFRKGNFSPNASWILIPVSIAMIILMIAGIIDTYRGRLIIHQDSLTTISTFSNRELKFDEIKGYTVNENYIFVEPNNTRKKRIKISKYTSSYKELLIWFSQTFPDLEEQLAIKEEQEILDHENLGWTREIREKKLLKARQISKVINWAAGITAAWIFFYPVPYQYSILTAMIIPFIALLAVKFSDGLIRIDERKGSAYPSVIHAFVFLSLGIVLRAVLDYNISDYSNVWLTTIITTTFFLFLLLIKQQEFTFKSKSEYLTVSILALLIFAYSFGGIIHVNCYYDNSNPQHFEARVLHKRIGSGKTTLYYLELSAWGQQKEGDEITIDKGLYNRLKVGDEVNIYLRNGKLDIPWFVVTDQEKKMTTITDFSGSDLKEEPVIF